MGQGKSNLFIVITGGGRSGTGYMSKVINQCGIKCGHEKIFTPNGISIPNTVLMADSSWMAVPHLHKLDCYILHIVRNPLNVFNSMLRSESFEHNTAYRRFIYRTLPELEKMPLIDKYLYFWVNWNYMAKFYADRTVQVENINKELLEEIGFNVKGELYNNKKYNTNTHLAGKPVELSFFRKSKYWQEFLKVSAKYGYKYE